MNRTRLFVGLLTALFLAAVGVGVIVGEDDRPDRLVAATVVVESTTTTVARTTTTTPTTTTTAPTTTSTTTPRPATTAAPATTRPTTPATTAPPATDPPTTVATTPPTTMPNALVCAEINRRYEVAGLYDDPGRLIELGVAECAPRFYE